MIVRKDHLRASKVMQQRVSDNPKIEILYNTNTLGLAGEEFVEGAYLVEYAGTEREHRYDIQIDGFFLAIGHQPNSALFAKYIETDKAGYIVTKGLSTATSVAGVLQPAMWPIHASDRLSTLLLPDAALPSRLNDSSLTTDRHYPLPHKPFFIRTRQIKLSNSKKTIMKTLLTTISVVLTIATLTPITVHADEYNTRQARSYIRDAEYQMRQAENYRRDANSYRRTAESYRRQMDSYIKRNDTRNAETYRRRMQNDLDRAADYDRKAVQADSRAADYLNDAARALRR